MLIITRKSYTCERFSCQSLVVASNNLRVREREILYLWGGHHLGWWERLQVREKLVFDLTVQFLLGLVALLSLHLSLLVESTAIQWPANTANEHKPRQKRGSDTPPYEYMVMSWIANYHSQRREIYTAVYPSSPNIQFWSLAPHKSPRKN